MHVGYGSFFQNLDGGLTDGEVWRAELEMADRAEGLGFDSVWTVEHHFTDYTMSPSPLQFLSWVAGRTQRVKLGSMVCVLPWHHPVRLAEEAAVLDHLSGGRLVLGIGRGLGRVEFDGLGVDMAQSRRLFTERAEAILEAFDTGKIDGVPIRPAPHWSLRGRTYASSISPESAGIMARLGVGIMIFLQKPWEQTAADLESYADSYRQINGTEPPKPLVVVCAGCGHDPAAAERMFEHAIEYYDSTIDHYGFEDPSLAAIPGYEYYGRIADRIAKHGRAEFASFLAGLQPCGTPATVIEQVTEVVRRLDAAGVIVVCSYGRMSREEARVNQDLFAREVLPALRSVDTGPDVGTGQFAATARPQARSSVAAARVPNSTAVF